MPGAPLMTTTGDFSAKASAVVLATFKPAHAISNANRAQSLHARISVGGETGALLIAGVDDAQFAFEKLIVKAEHVVAGNAEDMPHAVRVKPLDKVFADAG